MSERLMDRRARRRTIGNAVLAAAVALPAIAGCTRAAREAALADSTSASAASASDPAAPHDSLQASKGSGAGAPAVVVPNDARPTILFLGTSLTAGMGLDPTLAFPAVIGRMLDSAGHAARIVNAGISGETSAGARARIDWVLRQPADVIVVETGANDGLRGLSVRAARENIQTILDRIRTKQPRARVLLVQMEAPPNLGSAYTTAFHAMYPELAKANGVELVPFLLEGVAGIASLNQEDGMHPNRAGAEIVARNVYTALMKRPITTTATH
jgi:acyl-CoA thioesterase I